MQTSRRAEVRSKKFTRCEPEAANSRPRLSRRTWKIHTTETPTANYIDHRSPHEHHQVRRPQHLDVLSAEY